MTAKAFVGLAYLSDVDVPAANSRKPRQHIGVTGALELWLNIGHDAWASLDVAYADTRETLAVRSRLGYRVLPTLSLGIETALNRSDLAGQVQIEPGADQPLANGRLGAFARYEWFGGEISASGGLSADMAGTIKPDNPDDSLHRPAIYGTVNWILQF